MKYVLMDCTEHEIYNDEFDNKDEAIKAGDMAFAHLDKHDKKIRTAFFLLESVNPDEEAENHCDGNIVKEWM